MAYRLPRDYYARLAADYQAQQTACARRSGTSASRSSRPRGPTISWLTSRLLESMTMCEFARHLVRNVGVATVPGSSFFQDKALGRQYIRFCFCKRNETLDDAARRLQTLRVIV